MFSFILIKLLERKGMTLQSRDLYDSYHCINSRKEQKLFKKKVTKASTISDFSYYYVSLP